MTNRTFWDEEFKELNSIELSENQKIKLWKNIASKKQNRLAFFKVGLIYTAAIALFLVLTMSFLSGKVQTKNPTASHSVKPAKVEPAQVLLQKDSADWEQINRERYDLATIEKIQTKQNKVSIIVKRIKTYGTDPDPLGPVMEPDTQTGTYVLKTSVPEQTLHLEVNQKVLLKFAQYQPKGAADWFWAAEVVGVTKIDGKLYDANSKLLTLNLSSQVNIKDGNIN